jgi:hypothetical protein
MKVAFTLCSNNFLSYALTFADSFKKHNREYDVVIGIADAPSGQIDYKALTHRIVFMHEVGLPNLNWMIENYNIVELNTAVKPYYFEYLFNHFKAAEILFFDPDILVFGSVDSTTSNFRDYDVLLTPHVTQPIPQGVYPWENHFLNHGIYNLGFIGIKDTRNTRLLLKWWQERCATHCISDYRRGLYVDQLWANFIPLFFEKVYIDKNPCLNVAFWNLHERQLSIDQDNFFINKLPLVFFHFSAFNPRQPELLTKEQNTNLEYKSNNSVRALLSMYRQQLLANNYEKFSQVPFAFARDNSDALRALGNEIARKENLLGYLKFRMIGKLSVLSFTHALFKDYMNYNNLLINNINDTRYNNLDHSIHSRPKWKLDSGAGTNFFSSLKTFASSIWTFRK